MAHYIFIETRDPFDSRDIQFVEDTAIALKNRGHRVTVFLMQNGVFAAREETQLKYITRLSAADVNVLADDFSLSERGIQTGELHLSVRPSSIDTLVDALVQADTKAIWH